MAGVSLLFVFLFPCLSFAQLPPYPQTYQMNQSTIIMPCNESGFTDPSTVKGWHIIDFDWSNAKEIWAKGQPMDCEELLVEQTTMTVAASPGTTVWVYRNAIKALPWYTLVREKITDPAYGQWFMNFSGSGNYHVPQCDDNYSPPLCTHFYHDQEQTPEYPSGDGNCAAPACDVGSVPVGEYVFNHMAANVSVNGQTFLEWFIDDYFFGPTGAGNPNISGFYIDDYWSIAGPSEMDSHAVEDMGMSPAQVGEMIGAFNWVMDQVYAAILARGKFSWNQLFTIGNDCPLPMVSQDTCADSLRALCQADSPAQTRTMMYSFSPGSCHGLDPSNLTEFAQDLANFLLVRGPYAFLGSGWNGCSRQYEFPPELNLDYGEPLGLCEETAPNSMVFTREWTNAVIQMDCNTWTPSITWK